jgi:HK97 family phage prohead protease
MTLRDIADRASLTREVRDYAVDDVEIRSAEDGGLTFEGTASVVDAPYTVRDVFGEFQETIMPGAFNRTIKQKSDVRLLVNHEGVPLARTKSNTLTLAADPHLRAIAPSLDPKNPDVQRIQSAMGRGDMDQMSVGMRVRDQDWSGDHSERTIREIELFDVSIVTYPASPTTSALLRSVDDLLVELADVDLDEAELRRAIAALEARLPEPVPVASLRPEFLALWAKRPL